MRMKCAQVRCAEPAVWKLILRASPHGSDEVIEARTPVWVCRKHAGPTVSQDVYWLARQLLVAAFSLKGFPSDALDPDTVTFVQAPK